MIKRSKFPFLSEKDIRIKIMNEHINMTEKYFDELCSRFAALNRKLGRYRDKHDDLARILKSYSEEKTSTISLAYGLDSFSKAITMIADYIDIEVQKIDLQIVNELKQYENICRNTRENLKTVVTIRDKEILRQKQFIDLKTKLNVNSSTTDSELLKINIEVKKTNKDIETIIENFEKRRLKDIKNLFMSFIQIHIKQHAKAIEILSAAYQDIMNIDEKSDFQKFKKSIGSKKINELDKLRSQSVDNLVLTQHSKTLNKDEKYRTSKSTKDLTKRIGFTEKHNDDSNEESSEVDPYDDDDDDDDDDNDNNDDDEDKHEDRNSSNMFNNSRNGSSKSESSEDDYSVDDDEEDENTKDLIKTQAASSSRIPRFKQISENTSTPKITNDNTSNLVTIKSINGISKYHFVTGTNEKENANNK